jgi:16S rRNA (guanine527-N7)-methyltransferase
VHSFLQHCEGLYAINTIFEDAFKRSPWLLNQAKIHYSRLEKVEKVKKYFPELGPGQLKQLGMLADLYREWNARINVISRRDMDFFYERHVLHSLSVMKIVQFKPGTRLMDVGTGGGFPGIPLAICFPDCHFLLVDSIGKKIKVVREVAAAIGLSNVEALQARAEAVRGRFDFVLSRAVTALPGFMKWVEGKVAAGGFNDIPNGVLYLKGGDFQEEIRTLGMPARIYPLDRFFDEPFFETKKLVHLYGRSPKKFSDKANSS